MDLVFTYARGGLPALVLLAVWSSSLQGQVRPIPIDTVQVEVNSRASASLGALTRAVEVIQAEAIRDLPVLTVNDVLQWALGVEMMPRSPALADVGIRGSSFEQVLVLVDGARVRDAQTGHFSLNLAVPLDQIERIEVLRGPAASLYGSDAMGGVINVVTRRTGRSTALSLSRGTFETTAASFAHRQPIRGLQADVGGSYQRSDGHRSGTDYEMGMARLALAVPLAGEALEADVAYADRQFGADGFYGAFPSFETVRTTTASARWRLFADSIISLEPRLNYRRNTDDFILYRAEPDRSRNRHTSNQFGGELIGRWKVGSRTSLAFGVHGQQDRISSSALGEHDEWTAAASAEAAVGDAAGFAATAGIRADRLVGGSLVTSPAASLSWRPVPEFRVRSSVGRSFRSPTWTERFYPQVGGNVGNPDLDPEEAWSTDVGLEAYPLPSLRISGSLFLRKATDLIDWARPAGDPQGVWMTRNVESADFRGAEVELELPDVASFRISARGAWTSLRSSASGGFDSKYALRPQVDHVGLGIDRTFFEILTIGMRGARERRVGEDSRTRIDGRGALRLSNARLWVDVTNAGDEGYLDVVGNPAPGRSVSIGLEWRGGR